MNGTVLEKSAFLMYRMVPDMTQLDLRRSQVNSLNGNFMAQLANPVWIV